MKKCPVCNAGCFDDMQTCFSCMHSFSEAVEFVEPSDVSRSADADGIAEVSATDAPTTPAEATEATGVAETTEATETLQDQDVLVQPDIAEPPEKLEVSLVEASRTIRAAHAAPVRPSGRSALRRRGSVTTQHEWVPEVIIGKPSTSSAVEARYQLVVSLQPID